MPLEPSCQIGNGPATDFALDDPPGLWGNFNAARVKYRLPLVPGTFSQVLNAVGSFAIRRFISGREHPVNKVEFLEIVRTFRSGADSFQRLEAMLARRPQEPGLLCDMARRSAERGDVARAEILYRRLMNLRDGDQPQVVVNGMLGLASLQQQAGNLEGARGLARRAAQVHDADGEGVSDGLMAVALFQGTLADTLGMLDTYQILIDFDDMNFQALHGYARMAAATGVNLPQASRYALRAVVLSDNDPRIISTLSECYYQRHLPAKARRWIDKALAQDPGNDFYWQRAEVFQAAIDRFPAHRRGRRR